MAQDILPVIRAVMSKELITEHKMNQNDVARMLGVSQPAVSQYMRQLRGKANIKLKDEEKFTSEIKNLCKKINDGMKDVEVIAEMDNLCKLGASLVDEKNEITQGLS